MEQDYRISLDIYGGPLDLLLYLVQKTELDIFDINIAEVVDQYVKYVDALKEIDIDSAGEFLAMAARLLQIKSRMLLPRPQISVDEELIDPREQLVKELLEYRQFKEKALALEEKMKIEEKKFSPPGLAPGAEAEPQEIELESISVWDVMLAFHKVTKDLGLKLSKRPTIRGKPVSEYIPELLAKVSSFPSGACTFSSVFEGSADIATIIGTFLAILECARTGSLRFYQKREFGEIHLIFVPESERRKPQAALHGTGSTTPEGVVVIPDSTTPDSAEQYRKHHAGRRGEDSESARQSEGAAQ
jgi:segregation and condensation protein A